MYLGFIIIITGLVLLMILERLYPDQKLPKVKGWWISVVLINLYQLALTIGASYTWEKWLQIPCLINLSLYTDPMMGGVVAYIINTWIFYWWHRARHEIYFLWLLCHQFHHSPKRIEAVTSFYKHPMEILLDSIIMSILLYPVLGLTSESSIWLSGLSAFAEFFYHMNIKTPKWIGYFIQRPESHRIHHLRNRRYCKNYADLPIWDILGGTFENPYEMNEETGFDDEAEQMRVEMLCFRDVLKKISSKKSWKNVFSYETLYATLACILLLIGTLGFVGFTFNSTNLKGVAFTTGSSPLPLVFSAYNGMETFSTSFEIEAEIVTGEKLNIPVDHTLYANIKGPYNLRNVYGVMFSHGPFFPTEQLIKLRQQVLEYGICQGNIPFDLNYEVVKKVTIIVKSNSASHKNSDKKWLMEISCR